MAKSISQEYFDEVFEENRTFNSLSRSTALQETISYLEAKGFDLSNIDTTSPALLGEASPGDTETEEEQTRSVKTITQEHFNEAYIENMDMFCLNPSEALEETIFQFEAQGVNLSNIVKSVSMASDNNPIWVAIQNVKQCHPKNCLEYLKELEMLLKIDMAHKIYAGKMGAYEIILDKIGTCSSDNAVICSFIKTLTILMDGYPDLLEEKGVEFIISTLKKQDFNVCKRIFQWAYKCCLKHEKNRQVFMKAGIVEVLKPFVCVFTPVETFQKMCYFITSLTFDDDLREAISDAHKNACALASELLLPLNDCLKAHMEDSFTVSVILSTMSSLCVRNEFCELMMNEGFLKVMENCLTQFLDNPRVHTKAFKLLSSLAGNDDVKLHIIRMGSLIASSMSLHGNCLEHCVAGSNLVAALCLRSELNSKMLYDLGCADIIMRNMKTHKNSSRLQMASCRALRNMASRNPKISAELIESNIEDLILEVTKVHEDCKNHAKELLKQIGCKVQLIELWTGKKGDKLK